MNIATSMDFGRQNNLIYEVAPASIGWQVLFFLVYNDKKDYKERFP